MNDITFNAGTATNMTNKAKSLAKLEGVETQAAIGIVLKAKEDSQGGPVRVFLAMTKNYGDKMDDFPKPGEESGNNPEKYKVEYDRQGPNGLTKATKTVSFYSEFFNFTKEGIAIANELEQIKLAGDPKAVHDDVPDHIMDMNPEEREARRTYLTGRRTTAANAYRTAMALAFQLDAISSLEHAEANLRIDDNGEPIPGSKAIVVRDPKDPTKYELYSVGAFLLLNAEKARENGGTVKAVKESVKRKAKAGAAGSVAAPQTISTMDTFEARITDVHQFMDKVWSAKDKAAYQDLLKKVGPRGPAGSDDLALSLYAMHRMLGDIYRHDAIRARAERLYNDDVTGDKMAEAV